jgi:tetratricopeptide (TPR) repeat protein
MQFRNNRLKKILLSTSVLCLAASTFGFLPSANLQANARQLKASNASAAKVANLTESAQKSFEQKNYNYAIEQYKSALALDDNNPGTHFGLGASYLVIKEYNLAAEYLTRAIELNPAMLEAYFSLSMAYEGLSQHNNAIKAFRQGLGLDLNSALPRIAYTNQVTISSDEASSDKQESRSRRNINEGLSQDNNPSSSSLAIVASPDPEPDLSQSTSSEFPADSQEYSKSPIRADEADKEGNETNITSEGKESLQTQLIGLNTALKENPDDIRVKQKLALTYARLGMYDNAQTLVSEIQEQSDYLAEELSEEINKIKDKNKAKKIAEPKNIEVAKPQNAENKEYQPVGIGSTESKLFSSKGVKGNPKSIPKSPPKFIRQKLPTKAKPTQPNEVRKSPYKRKRR